MKTIKTELLVEGIRDFYYYTKSQVYYKLERYSDATLSLKKITEESEFYLRKMTLLLRICIKSQDYEMISEIKKILSKYRPNKNEMKSKVFYHYLIQENDNDRKEYLRDIAIPFSIQIEDYDTLKEYTDTVMEICVDNSRYKEATQYYRKYQKEISKIRRILY